MHAGELVELAAIISEYGPLLIQSRQPIPAGSIEQYWVASKLRFDRWASSLKSFSQHANADARRRQARWPAARGVLEEILTSEVLTRVWTAVLCAHDRRRGTDEVEPVARSVMIGHTESRHRVLIMMVRGPGIDAEAALKLNRLRRQAERWSDLLVGHLAGLHDVSEFAVDPKRAKDFAEDWLCRRSPRGGRQAWPLLMASLRAGFQRALGPDSPNADLNARIAAAILSCYPADLFDSTGLLRSLWMMRLSNVTEDTQGMIEELLARELPTASPDPGSPSDIFGERRRGFGR